MKKNTLYPLENYLRVLASINKIYHSKKQRNVNDCLNTILCILNNELNRLNNNNNNKTTTILNQSDRDEVIQNGIINFKNTYDSKISDIFNWFELKQLNCLCGEKIFSFNNYHTYQLDILEFSEKVRKTDVNLFDCLNFELRKKQMKYCNNCKKITEKENISIIYSSPKYFIFLLNNGNFDEKLLDFQFSIEERINLNKLIEEKNSPRKYELIGIVSIDVKTKKYVSFCKGFQNQQWYLFRDENYTKTKINEIMIDNNNSKFIPCILFYKSLN